MILTACTDFVPMANFNTHLTIALATSSSLATAGLMIGAFGFFEMILLAIIGAIGGLLPDIDLDNSKISQMAFNIASLFGASFLLLLFANFRPNQFNALFEPIDMIIAWGVLALVLKFGVFFLFSKFTRHRGAVHSIPYMAMLALLLVLLSYRFLNLSIPLSWLFGIFLFFGALVHLILDEIYSVNVYGLRTKRSFGTALKFYDKKQPITYLILYGICIGLIMISPPITPLTHLISPLFSFN